MIYLYFDTHARRCYISRKLISTDNKHTRNYFENVESATTDKSQIVLHGDITKGRIAEFPTNRTCLCFELPV